MKKKLLAVLITTAMIFSSSICGVWADSTSTVTYSKALTDTQNYIAETLKNPECASIGGEWAVIGMARSGYKNTTFYKNYVNNLTKAVKAAKGQLSSRKYTEYSRVILAYTSMGKSVKNISGYNFLEKLADFDAVKKQGINGSIWALIALDSGNYAIPTVRTVKNLTTRSKLIQEITNAELINGGFNLSGDKADPDVTAMAVTALAPYYKSNESVKPVVDRSIEALSKLQLEDGTFASSSIVSEESSAQVVTALSAVGIDSDKDSRFVKNGKSALDGLLSFYVSGGGFRHTSGGSLNQMATEQGLYALTAYNRFVKGKTPVFKMTDVSKVAAPAKVYVTLSSPAKGKLAVSWKKASGAKGYQIKYSNSRSFSSSKTIYVSASTLKKTVSSLKRGKNYYVKVRAYDKGMDGIKVYGKYSSVKKIRIK